MTSNDKPGQPTHKGKTGKTKKSGAKATAPKKPSPKTSMPKEVGAKAETGKPAAIKAGAARPTSSGTQAAKPALKKPADPANPASKKQSPRAIPSTSPGLPWRAYGRLMRLDRPVGTLLLLWPTLWALWLAAEDVPRWDLLAIFALGVFLMRSAGCVINDFADRKIDGHVARTRDRPLVTGEVSTREAIILFVVLCLLALGLVLLTNPLTIQLSLGGVLLAFCYPFMKRYTQLPQVVLGAAFAWSIPMAFAAQRGVLAQEIWLVYIAVVLWTLVYDTFYAMVDRDDDVRIGVKSTAILFGEQDRVITAFLQGLTLFALVLVGRRFELTTPFYISLVVAAALFAYQQLLIRYRERNACFKAFLNNNWVGLVVFLGIVASYF